MRLLDDERGQSVQVGAAILLGFVVIAITMYQVEVVADQNAEIEFNHQQEVRQDMIDLRNSISNAGTTGESEATSVELGARYPARSIFVNPPPARGVLDSEPAGNVSLSNADVDGGPYAGEGNPNSLVSSTHRTNRLVYTPQYSEFGGAGNLTIEHSLAFASFDGGFSDPMTSQPVVDGDSLTLTMLRGNLSEQGVDARSVDPRTVSRTEDPITISQDNSSEPITLTLPTRSPAVWNETIGTNYTDGESQARVDDWDPAAGEIRVSLDRPEYDLRMAAVGIGTGVEETIRYDVRRAGGGSGGGGGAYSLSWTNPDDESANGGADLSGCGSETCTWDVGASPGDTLTLNTTLSPPYAGINLDYAIDDPSVGTVSPSNGTTGSDGSDQVTLHAQSNGTVEVLATANDASRAISIDIVNVPPESGDNQPPTFDSVAAAAQDSDGDTKDVEFVRVSAETSDNSGVDRVEVIVMDPDSSVIGSNTFGSSFTLEDIELDPDQDMNGFRYVEVELTAFDVNGNSRTCTGQIENTGGSIDDSDFDCSQTST